MSEKNTPAAGAEKSAGQSTPQEAPKAKLMAGVQNKDQFLYKAGPVYLHNNKRIDLRTITDGVAQALANDPACAFLQWKDEKKRPTHQRNAFPDGWKNPS